jgi:hypothetical protein
MKVSTARIRRLIAKAEAESVLRGSQGYLPDVINTLRAMEAALGAAREERTKITSGLGRLVTDDEPLLQSELGLEVLKVAEDFRKY